MERLSHNSRLAAAVLAIGAAVATGAGSEDASAAKARLAVPDATNVASALPPRVDRAARRRFLAAAVRWSTFRRSAGPASVTVRVSDAYASPEDAARRWGDFLLGLVHGGELDGITLALATPGEVASLCGADSAGCYGSAAADIVAIGETSLGVRPEAVVAHEYGHYIAARRQNTPWNALAWGPKRWASAAAVCARVAAGSVFPGADGDRYHLNPGEAFAETYRLLNAQPFAGTGDWPIVSRLFFPDARMLRAARSDVLEPWASPAQQRIVRGLPSTGRLRVDVATPLDGTLDFRVDGARVDGAAAGRRAVCGTRRTPLTVVGEPAATFALTVSRP